MRVECAPGIVRNLIPGESCVMPDPGRIANMQSALMTMLENAGYFDPGTMGIVADLGARFVAGALTNGEASSFETLLHTYAQTMYQMHDEANLRALQAAGYPGPPEQGDPSKIGLYAPIVQMTEPQARAELERMIRDYGAACFMSSDAQVVATAAEGVEAAKRAFAAFPGDWAMALNAADEELGRHCPGTWKVGTSGDACCVSCGEGGECEGDGG